MKVLVVEDDVLALEALAAVIQRSGHDVRSARSPEQALSIANRFVPEVVVCDWQLGDQEFDGLDVARSIQAASDAQIVMITARDLDELRRSATGIKIARFFRKPFSTQRITEFLKSL